MTNEDLRKYVSDSVDAAKKANALEPYLAVKPYADNGALPTASHYAYGWIVYYALHQAAAHEIAARKQMLAAYLKLTTPRPHKLHSMILTEAIRLHKDAKRVAFGKPYDKTQCFSIVRFCDLWGLPNLRDGDWRRKEYEGKPMTSTAEKLITACVDELEDTSIKPTPSFIATIDKALEYFPDSPSLLMQRASIHAAGGQTEEAKALLRKAILNAPGKFFLWHRLALLTSKEDNMRLHVALLHRALNAPGQEQFKGRVRLDLADALASKGLFGEARKELDQAKRVYEANGWHLPKSYHIVNSSIPADTAPKDPSPLYGRLDSIADEEIYSALPEIEVIKTYHKNPELQQSGKSFGKPATVWRVTDSSGNNFWLQPHRFGINPDLPTGTPLKIRVHNGKPVKCTLLTP